MFTLSQNVHTPKSYCENIVLITFQCLVMYLIILMPNTRKEYRRLYNFAGHFIYANSKSSLRNHSVCDRMAIDLLFSSLKTNTLLVFSISLSVCVPMYKMFYTDEREMFIPVILPFVDPDTENGFYLNLASQLITASFGAIAIPAIELVTCVLKNNVLATAAVVNNSILELKNQMESDGLFTMDRMWKFRNIILKTLDFDRFVQIFGFILLFLDQKIFHNSFQNI